MQAAVGAPLRVLLVRHGHSTNNALIEQSKEEYDAHRVADAGLTTLGEGQAICVGELLAKRRSNLLPPADRLARVYTSPMVRALATAEKATQVINDKDVKPIVWTEIHELGGVFINETDEATGKSYTVGKHGITLDEVKARFPSALVPLAKSGLPTVEPTGWYTRPMREDALSAQKRVCRVINALFARAQVLNSARPANPTTDLGHSFASPAVVLETHMVIVDDESHPSPSTELVTRIPLLEDCVYLQLNADGSATPLTATGRPLFGAPIPPIEIYGKHGFFNSGVTVDDVVTTSKVVLKHTIETTKTVTWELGKLGGLMAAGASVLAFSVGSGMSKTMGRMGVEALKGSKDILIAAGHSGAAFMRTTAGAIAESATKSASGVATGVGADKVVAAATGTEGQKAGDATTVAADGVEGATTTTTTIAVAANDEHAEAGEHATTTTTTDAAATEVGGAEPKSDGDATTTTAADADAGDAGATTAAAEPTVEGAVSNAGTDQLMAYMDTQAIQGLEATVKVGSKIIIDSSEQAGDFLATAATAVNDMMPKVIKLVKQIEDEAAAAKAKADLEEAEKAAADAAAKAAAEEIARKAKEEQLKAALELEAKGGPPVTGEYEGPIATPKTFGVGETIALITHADFIDLLITKILTLPQNRNSTNNGGANIEAGGSGPINDDVGPSAWVPADRAIVHNGSVTSLLLYPDGTASVEFYDNVEHIHHVDVNNGLLPFADPTGLTSTLASAVPTVPVSVSLPLPAVFNTVPPQSAAAYSSANPLAGMPAGSVASAGAGSSATSGSVAASLSPSSAAAVEQYHAGNTNAAASASSGHMVPTTVA